MIGRKIGFALAVGMVLLAGVGPVWAQATRTWVSGLGDDANPCSRTAPCKTFAGAISKTAANGEIDALDPAGFGGVTITKAITIDGTGTLAGVLVSGGTNGITVNAGASDNVVLRGLDINGTGTGLIGVRFIAGHTLHVERCTIDRFTGAGISFEAGADLFVTDTTVLGTGGGIFVQPASGTAHATIDRTRLVTNAFGLHVKGSTFATVVDSNASGNAGEGFWAETAPAELNIEGSVAAGNGVGIRASDSGLVRITGATVTGNASDGLLAETSGTIVPFRDNQIAGNPPGVPGAPACEIDAGTTSVGCPDVLPVCQAPIVTAMIGPCHRCRTRQGTTTCSGCAVQQGAP